MTPAQRRMTMKRYEAGREKVDGLLEFYTKNNIQYKFLEDSPVFAKTSQISDAQLHEMTVVHKIEDIEAAAELTSDQSNFPHPVVFEEASNSDEERPIHQEGILFTSNKAVKPFPTIKMAIARVLDVQQLINFVTFSDPDFC